MAFLILKIGHLTLLTTVTYNNCKPTHIDGELDYKTRNLWASWRWRLKRCKKYKFSWVTCKLDNIARAREEKCIKYRWRSTSCRAKHLSGRSLTHHTCSIFCSCSRVILFWVPIGYGSRWSLLIGRRWVLCAGKGRSQKRKMVILNDVLEPEVVLSRLACTLWG